MTVHKQEIACIIKKYKARISSLALNSERVLQIMHPGRPLVLFGAASVVAILSGSFLLHAYQAAVPKPNYDPPENLVRTDFPSWPYPRGIHDTRKEDGTLFHVPGSTQEFTLTQINGNPANHRLVSGPASPCLHRP